MLDLFFVEKSRASQIKDLLLSLADLSGGATRSLSRSEVQGVWCSVEDTSIRFEIGLPEDKVDTFMSMLPNVAHTFGQECIYVVVKGTRAFLGYRNGGAK